MTRFRQVWSHPGPPVISVEEANVVHNQRNWAQRRIVVNDGKAGVVVVPVRGDRVGLITIWRPSVDEVRLELPRGFGESLNPVDDACRELLEETGLRAGAVHSLGEFNLDTGLTPTRIVVFQVGVDGAPQEPTDREIDGFEWIDSGQFTSLVAKGRICDGISLAAFAMWSVHQRSHQ